MRRLAITYGYLQAVGRTQNGKLLCSSLGTHLPIDLGPVSYVGKGGLTVRSRVHLSLLGDEPLGILEQGSFASILNPRITLDATTDSSEVALATFSPKHRILNKQHGRIDFAWLRGSSNTEAQFRDKGALVEILQSQRYDLASIAAIPMVDLDLKVKEAQRLSVPIGVVCGLLLAGAVFYIARIRFSLPTELRAAARRDEFFLEYQPVVDLVSRQWIGAEALVRWRQRSGEIVRPDLFVPMAENAGLMEVITKCVLRHVALDLPLLIKETPTFRLGVNLSAADLRSSYTTDALRSLLTSTAVHPSHLIVEATERGFLQDASTAAIIDEIRELGIDVAIDDFGTGYSSLSTLEKLKVTDLKIDKSFVETIGKQGATSQVVVHIIEMAHALNLKITAEGVETEEQAEFLAARGVRFAQGWLFGKPMSVSEMVAHLSNLPPKR